MKGHHPLEILKIHNSDNKRCSSVCRHVHCVWRMQVSTCLLQSCVSECDLGQYGNSFTSLFFSEMDCDQNWRLYICWQICQGERLEHEQHLTACFCYVGGQWLEPSPHLTSNKTKHITTRHQGHKTDETVCIPS